MTRDYSEILLSAGRVAIVDEEDAEWLNQWKWSYTTSSRAGYALRQERRQGRSRTVYMHRALTGAAPGTTVLHLDDNGLNNRRANLHVATMSLNMQMGAPRQDGYRGAHYDKSRGFWRAHGKIHGKVKHLGTFQSAEDAARAYDAFVLEHFGPLARTNFPVDR